MRFAPAYVSAVLRENFEDAKRLFFSPLIAIHEAHLVMLAERAIVRREDARRIRDALADLAQKRIAEATYDGGVEDLFCHVNGLLDSACGPDVAGRLHTARSRNDIDATMYRMRQREYLLELLAATLLLRRTLLALSDRHPLTVLALHTHTQPAQPSTVAHYLLAAIEQLERDAVRIRAAFEVTNRSPLGACAITGTGFDIDRRLTAELLGFDGPTGNTYGSISSVDYMLQNAGAASIALTGLGRVLQDMLLWSTSEFGYLRLGDGFVQGSSIMPQKRNPVALEHARAIASKAVGEAAAIAVAVHNTPFGDTVDTEDDLQPLVVLLFHDACRAVYLTAAAMETADFDAVFLESRAAEGGTTLTELADTFVRDHGLAFSTAHAIAARVRETLSGDPSRPLTGVVKAASEELAGRPLVYEEGRLSEILSPRHFVLMRTTHGGPAPERTAEAIAGSRDHLGADERWLSATRGRLSASAERRRQLLEGI
jgi:argininosuccinate lyase